jgi:phosphoribosyl-ATP pyrophosphohydrolase/phosphoribosyl-AMP cyclohydrolase
MLAYADREALQWTVRSGEAHFFSRSRKTLWHKGGISGDVMKVAAVLLDCDADAVCYEVVPAGPACHTGAESCFFECIWGVEGEKGPDACDLFGSVLGPAGKRSADAGTLRILARLASVIEQRKKHMPAGSYVVRLLQGGAAGAARKVGEEAAETIVAALAEDDTRLVSEVADLWFHSMVLLASRDRSLEDVCEELASRDKGGSREPPDKV